MTPTDPAATPGVEKSEDRPPPPLPRRLLAEAVGTWLLTAVSIAPDVFTASLGISVPDAVKAVTPGMTVALVIYAIGDVSGAHINPAVTTAFALRRAFPWGRVGAYVAAQLLGAVLAALLFRLRFGTAGSLGASRPHVDAGLALATEVILTAVLVSVILNVSTRESLVGPGAALPVGIAIALDGLIAGHLTGASMNPARSLGPVLVSGEWHSVWIYVLGPLLGALLATGITYVVRGAYSASEQEAAKGEP
jgi:aquaporin Z